ncbi:hypothetical protein [Ralstonia solanacearum]|uniref:hypothetical protein n=1 Tax=Ralstonia solanacearum TaxID=305 RepID=UPI00113FD1AE|nr:hypothetical protein [Ralstonia solanacearum]
MKCFLIGAAGALLVVLLSVFAFTQYSNYRGRAQTEGVIVQVESIKKDVEEAAIKRNSFAGIDGAVVKFRFHDPIDFADIVNGNIIARGAGGQILIFSPSFARGQVEWRCMGAPSKDVPEKCRG